MLQDDGWTLVVIRGSHRQFKHPTKKGRVTVAGKPSDTIPPGTLASLFRQAGWDDEDDLGVDMKRYAIVVEQADGNYGAYVPDLPGCVATGATVPEVEAAIKGAIEMHLEGLAEDGLPIPEPSSQVDYVEVVV